MQERRAVARRRAFCRTLLAGWTLAVALVAWPAAAADLGLNAYGDLIYSVERQGQTSNSFSTPRLELFLTAAQDKLAFLTETMFEVGDNNEFGVDVERVEVAYLFTDWFRLRMGRFHTAIGYYNDAYHHGRYFQTTVDRPAMVRFEDEGGLIPAHSVGVHADGRFSLGAAGSLRYDVDVANGRGRTPAEVTNLVDPNNGKMVNLRLRIEPALLDGLIVGANLLFDGITAATTADPAGPSTFVREVMVGAHLAYLENNLDVIGEYLRVSHRADGATGVTHAFFLELGYAFGRFTPYLRGERIAFPSVIDPFFGANAIFLGRASFWSGLAGLRFMASEYLALKLEGELIDPDSGTAIKSGSVQCAFAF